MKIKVNDKRTVKNGKEIANEIELNIGNISCELFVFDVYSCLDVHQNYLITGEFVDIFNSMSSYGYQFQGINCVEHGIHFIFYRTEKTEL
jgi:hypothetical protein